MWQACVLVPLLVAWTAVGQEQVRAVDGVEVETTYGRLLGSRVKKILTGVTHDEFLGIPFAAPPVGALRWEKPQPPESWEGVRNATEYSIHCTHFIAPLYRFLGMGGQHGEDCLYLNVFVPHGVGTERAVGLPVMVYLYGGAFILGTGEMYPGHELALHGDTIVVNINYRVSSLGWLNSGGDGVLPGNYGLWDAKAALQWVQDNIANFGGDPQRVTLFGQSAGGAMTSHAVISPQFDGLLHRAIAISGSAIAPFGQEQANGDGLQALSEVFLCNTTDSQEIVDCLREQDAHDLDFWGVVAGSGLAPALDGDLIPMEAREAMEQGRGMDKDFITGCTKHDMGGLLILNPIAMPALGDKNNLAGTQESWDGVVRGLMGFAENTDELVELAYEVYPDMTTPDNLTRTLAATAFGTDWFFCAPSHLEASIRSRNEGAGSTFLYQYAFRHGFMVGYPDWIEGSHLDDIYTIFGTPFMERYRRLVLRTDWEARDLSANSDWMSYLTNFAQTGDPNTGLKEVPTLWSSFDADLEERLSVAEERHVETIPEEQSSKYDFWMNEFLDRVVLPDAAASTRTERGLEERALATKALLQGLVGHEELAAAIGEVFDSFIQRRRERLAA